MGFQSIRRLFVKEPRPDSRRIAINHFSPSSLINNTSSSSLLPQSAAAAPPAAHNYKYPKNEIITSRYTIINFFPKNIFEQFQRIANFYFLLVSIVQLFIDSPVNPITSIAPLIFVIFVSAVKQAYEDWKRHQADNEVNQRIFDVIHENGEFQSKKAMDIEVGDMVCCRTNEGFPCDMLLLSTSEDTGQCYVTTASLDGETNLKVFSSLTETKAFTTPNDLCHKLAGLIECQEPIDDLYNFVGKMWIENQTTGQLNCRPLAAENLLLRGAVLKNTEFTIGCAVYTGLDTKMALNSKGKRPKVSQVENRLNVFLMIYFIILLIFAVISIAVQYAMKKFNNNLVKAWYIPNQDVNAWIVIQNLFGFIILYNYLIPISLYVTIELQKFFGAKFITLDLELYDDKLDIPAKANTSDLNEELGQVKYLFSDKTGTLTENEMKFRFCSINGQRFVDMEGSLCRQSYTDGDVPKMLSDDWMKNSNNAMIVEFFTVLALCHTVRIDTTHKVNRSKDFTQSAPAKSIGYPNRAYATSSMNLNNAKDGGLGDGMEYEYQASSPDEKAFVETCRSYGIVFHGYENGNEYILTFGEASSSSSKRGKIMDQKREKKCYRLLQTLDFDSERKCMTVVMKYPDDSIHVHCKGAETAMLERNRVGPDSVDKDIIMNHVTDYASEGFRTLVIATKQISEEDYQRMSAQLDAAKTTFNNRESALKVAYANFESNLRLLGCTAIEDRLQDGVPETIIQLRKAGIQVWVLTGDKEETAINISYSAGHFSADTNKIPLTKKTGVLETYRAILSELESIATNPLGENSKYGLVVDGQTLKFAMKTKVRPYFVELCLSVDTVLCCRMTPLQKADVVALIKQNVKPEPVTVAIGDGANDVSMIQEAHVGLGIYGKEGRQAVRSADYAFARFRHTRRLLLVHGHYFYVRLALLINYFFYKNLAFISAQFYFAIFSGFSAQSIYHAMYLMFYNLTCTSLPILMFGIFEKILSQDILYYKPELYGRNRDNNLLSWKQFLKWNALGLWHSLVIYFCIHYLLYDGNTSIMTSGQTDDFYSMGTLMFVSVWIVVNIKVLLTSHSINWTYIFALIPITFGLNIAMMIGLTQIYFSFSIEIYGVWIFLFSSPSSWIIMLFVNLLCLMPDVVLKYWEDYLLMRDIGLSPRKWKRTVLPTVALRVSDRNRPRQGNQLMSNGIENVAFKDPSRTLHNDSSSSRLVHSIHYNSVRGTLSMDSQQPQPLV